MGLLMPRSSSGRKGAALSERDKMYQNRLSRIMGANIWTQSRAARELGVDQSTLSKYMRGQVSMANANATVLSKIDDLYKQIAGGSKTLSRRGKTALLVGEVKGQRHFRKSIEWDSGKHVYIEAPKLSTNVPEGASLKAFNLRIDTYIMTAGSTIFVTSPDDTEPKQDDIVLAFQKNDRKQFKLSVRKYSTDRDGDIGRLIALDADQFPKELLCGDDAGVVGVIQAVTSD
jgi:transcriptional regulator with XRE-family HTH domain